MPHLDLESYGIIDMSECNTFAINPGETNLEGLLRTTEIMTKQLDWNTPRETQSWDKSFFTYSLIRHYIGLYDAIPKKELMIFLLKYPEVTDLYNRVKEISERPHYTACMALMDGGIFT